MTTRVWQNFSCTRRDPLGYWGGARASPMMKQQQENGKFIIKEGPQRLDYNEDLIESQSPPFVSNERKISSGERRCELTINNNVKLKTIESIN